MAYWEPLKHDCRNPKCWRPATYRVFWEDGTPEGDYCGWCRNDVVRDLTWQEQPHGERPEPEPVEAAS